MDPSWGIWATPKARNLIDASFCPLTFSSSLKVGAFVLWVNEGSVNISYIIH